MQGSQDLRRWDQGPKGLPFPGSGFSPMQSQPEGEVSKPWSQRQRKEPSVLSQKPWLPHMVSLAHSSMSVGQGRLQCRVCSLFSGNSYLFGLLTPRFLKANF